MKKNPDVSGLVTNIAFNTKIKEAEDKIPDVGGLADNTAFNKKIKETIDKIPNDDKLITTQKFNKLRADNFTGRLKVANSATKNNLADFLKKQDYCEKLKKI